MPSGFEITCANKNYRGIIVRIGGEGWNMETRDAIVKIVNKRLRLSIRVNGTSIEVGVRGDGIDSYLALEPDGRPLHDLTDLPSC